MGIRCPRCRKDIELPRITTSAELFCPHCGRTFEAVRFDPPDRRVLQPELVDGRAAAVQPCAVHERNAAVGTCERCGAFMCDLCRITVDDRDLCPSCFERLASEGTLETARTTFRDFGGMASVSALGGCLIWFLGFLLGPLAIYYGVKGLKQKRAMGERDGIVGIWLAMAIGAVEFVGSIVLVVTIMTGVLN